MRNILKATRSWPWALILLALPATVAVWSGWVGLGSMTGFGKVHPLPGIADGFTLDSAITLPVGVEVYGAYALGVWLSHRRYSDGTRRFACVSSIGGLILGGAGQVAYHLLEVAYSAKVTHVAKESHRTVEQVAKDMPPSAPWWITTIVACFPVLVLGAGATLAHLTRRDLREAVSASVAEHAPEFDPEPWPEDEPTGFDRWEEIEPGPATWERWPLPELPASGGRTLDKVAEQDTERDGADIESGQEISHPDGSGHAGQVPPVDLASAVKSARAAGMSKRSIAEEFGLTRYRVDQLLDAQPQPIAAVNGHALTE